MILVSNTTPSNYFIPWDQRWSSSGNWNVGAGAAAAGEGAAWGGVAVRVRDGPDQAVARGENCPAVADDQLVVSAIVTYEQIGTIVPKRSRAGHLHRVAAAAR